MNKDNILFGVVGLLAGLIIGFMFANSVNKQAVMPVAAADMKTNSNIPPGHPEIPPGATVPGGGTAGAMQPETQAAIDKAKQSPNDFQAQVAAADMYNQIERYDDAIIYLKKANQLKPDDREIVVHLGNANFDGNHFDEAEKWYIAALAKKADDVNVRTDLGLTFVFRDPPNYDRAIQEFSKSLESDPNHVQTLQNLTVAYTKKGD
ncbi:MAG TPA: tetratricopeptide repeat protein, partial [Pyrinomonadaceae bacterium]|nr:tetratricopeptide repeat protein [Pyrinomonadaceae bacterium]